MLGAKEAGNCVEKIFLRDKRINYCNACDACQGKGGKCVQKDDMAEVLDKMIAADVIVMASPVYFYTMSGQMKTLIDRTYSRYTEISNKEMYFILTAADGRKQAMEGPWKGSKDLLPAFPGQEKRESSTGPVHGRMETLKEARR